MGPPASRGNVADVQANPPASQVSPPEGRAVPPESRVNPPVGPGRPARGPAGSGSCRGMPPPGRIRRTAGGIGRPSGRMALSCQGGGPPCAWKRRPHIPGWTVGSVKAHAGSVIAHVRSVVATRQLGGGSRRFGTRCRQLGGAPRRLGARLTSPAARSPSLPSPWPSSPSAARPRGLGRRNGGGCFSKLSSDSYSFRWHLLAAPVGRYG
jgi:hypothetical protein